MKSKLDLTKMEHFCSSPPPQKKFFLKIKKQAINWGKIFVEHISVKGLTYIFIKFLQLNEKTIQFKNEQRI